MKKLTEYAKAYNVDFEWDLGLARGLSYYTGTIFEVNLKQGKVTSSVAGGGRYDNIISEFLNSKQNYPAVGISFGVDRIFDIIKPGKKETVSDVFIIPINTEKKAIKIVQKFRASGINSEIDLMSRGVGKNLNYANTQGIPYVIFAGEKELNKKKVKLRDMKTGKESLTTVEAIIKKLMSK